MDLVDALQKSNLFSFFGIKIKLTCNYVYSIFVVVVPCVLIFT